MQAVRSELDKEAMLTGSVMREDKARKSVKRLRQSLKDLKEERVCLGEWKRIDAHLPATLVHPPPPPSPKEREIAEKTDMIAQLKDQLQETKSRAALEGKYIKKEALVRVAVAQKKCQQQTRALSDRAKELQRRISEEQQAHKDIEDFLKRYQLTLAEKLDEWVNKYETDNEDKQKELDTLKSDRARDLSRLQGWSPRGEGVCFFARRPQPYI